MMTLAEKLILGKLPTGLIVGTAKIIACSEPGDARGLFAWHLVDVERLAKPIRSDRQPQPVWWRPF